MAIPEFCWTDLSTGEQQCQPMWYKKKPDPIKVEPEPEPQPDWTKDLLNLLIAESAVAQIRDIELRDRLAAVIEEASLAVARNVGANAMLTRSFG